jgi:NAD(P)-dependent dehydrogenase (short-subunit alcohol dehydrogenase family)
MTTSLQGKTALVTGASRGIGRATALKLAKQGAHVIAHYNSAKADAESLAKEILSAGGKADIVSANLAASDGAHKLADAVRKLLPGKLDILVANAGVAKMGAIEALTVKEFDELFAVNVRAPYFLVQQLLPVLGKGASIVMISSVVARTAISNLVAYSATKGAVSTMVKHFAAALGEQGIRVNAVAPGVIETDLASFVRTNEGQDMALSMQALKRIGQPEDISSVVAFLAGDDSRWVTGEILEASGGSKL